MDAKTIIAIVLVVFIVGAAVWLSLWTWLSNTKH